MLNIIIGALIDVSISTPGRAIARQTVHFRRTHFQLGNLHSSLVGARHAITNDVIISDTMLRSLVPTQLRPMTDNHKMMCGCAICNTSKYIQESLNAWRRKQ